MSFIIFPAIDLMDGKCVRLQQGRAEEQTVYSDDPVAIATQWELQGAQYLHLVDLDGAFQGKPVHTELIREIVKALTIPVELGGGMREEKYINEAFQCGVSRVIVGTSALRNPEQLQHWTQQFRSRLAVGIDARDGWVQVSGWTDTSKINALEFALRVEAAGVETIIYTDTSRDGMLKGTNTQAISALCDTVSCAIIASGGVSTANDIRDLLNLNKKSLRGAIVGKALYDETTTLKKLTEVIKNEH